MRYAFIINPASGKGKAAAALRKQIEALAREDDRDIRIYETAGPGDATVLAGMIADEAAAEGEEVNIYACGGDGTILETVNGIVGHPNVRFGFMPVGSGNDFVRNFEAPKSFKDLHRQLDASWQDTDVLSFTYEKEGVEETRYYINAINIGFDGNTAILAHDLKELPLVSGSFSYILALIHNLVQKKGENLTVTVDGETIHDGPLLLCTVANGGFCGGGFNSCPKAILDDGLAEIQVVRDIPRLKFLTVAPKYKAGRLFQIKEVNDIVTYRQGREILITPKEKTMNYVADGEIYSTGPIRIRIIEHAIRVLVP